MERRASSTLLSSLLVAIAACASGSGPGASAPAPAADLGERVGRLERELAVLRQGAPETGGATAAAEPPQAPAPAEPTPAAPPPAAPPPPADKPLLQWNVTPDITFKPGLRLQTRYAYDTRTDNNELYVARFRLKAGGEVYEIAKYYLELKIDNTGRSGASPSAAVENGWLDFTYGPELIGRAGLYDVPFSRDALTSDSKLLFVDRSIVKDALTSFGLADNGIGVMARGRPFGGRFEYAVGAFNNDKFDGFRTSSSRQTGWLMPTGRVAVDLLDPAPPGGYADYRASYIGEGRRLSIAANGAWLGNARDTVNGVRREFDVFAWGTDLFFNWGPWTLQAEYDWFRQTGDVDRSNHGWYVQGGYLLEPLNERLDRVARWFPDLELAARYQELDAKSAAPKQHWTSLGMNLYIHQHNLKIQTDYSFRNIEGTRNSDLYQLQLQLDF